MRDHKADLLAVSCFDTGFLDSLTWRDLQLTTRFAGFGTCIRHVLLSVVVADGLVCGYLWRFHPSTGFVAGLEGVGS